MSREPIRQPLIRRAPPKVPLHPDAEVRRAAIQRLTGSPDWQVMIDHLKAKEFEAWFMGPDQEPGALLRLDGRRSFLRELEGLGKRVTDDDRSGQHE